MGSSANDKAGAVPLSGLLGNSTTWERTSVPIDERLMVAAWAGLFAGVLSYGLYLLGRKTYGSYQLFIGEGVIATLLFADPWPRIFTALLVLLIPTVLLAFLTQGYRWAGPRLQVLVLVTAILPWLAALPLMAIAAVLLLNLALAILIGVAYVVGAGLLIAALLMGSDS